MARKKKQGRGTMSLGRRGNMGEDDDRDLETVARTAARAGKHWGMNVCGERDRELGGGLGIPLAAVSDDMTALGDGLGRIEADAKRELL